MGEITFRIEADDAEIRRPFSDGQNIMSAAVNGDVPGIEGECGGEMSCGTCHVRIGAPWADEIPRASSAEQDMLDVLEDPSPESRLGCQVKLSAALDGILVSVPDA